MFLEQGNKGRNEIGRWVAMIIIVVIVSQIVGAIPIQILISSKLSENPDLHPNPENFLDLAAYEIDPLTGFALMMIPFILGLFSLLILIKPIHGRSVRSLLTGNKDFRWKRFFWAAGIWFLLMAIYSIFATLSGYQNIKLQFDPKTLLILTGLSVLLLPLQTGFEEVFFRGYLMQGFSRILKFRWMPLLATSIIFGGLHIFNPEVKEFGLFISLSQYVWFGIIFGICVLMDDGIELAWGVHAMNNIFLAVFFTQDSSALQTPALFRITAFNPLLDLIAFLILSTLFIYLARTKFKWAKWTILLEKIEHKITQEEDYLPYPEDEYVEDDDK